MSDYWNTWILCSLFGALVISVLIIIFNALQLPNGASYVFGCGMTLSCWEYFKRHPIRYK